MSGTSHDGIDTDEEEAVLMAQLDPLTLPDRWQAPSARRMQPIAKTP
ncbi:MAG: hypothetical protein QM607_04990 [Microbacterium sp.]